MLWDPRAIPQSASILFMFSSYIVFSNSWNTTNDSGQMRISGFVKLAVRKRARQQMHLRMNVQEYFGLPVFPKSLRVKKLAVKAYWAPKVFM